MVLFRAESRVGIQIVAVDAIEVSLGVTVCVVDRVENRIGAPCKQSFR